MPIYIYKCRECDTRTEVSRSMSQSTDPFTCGCGSGDTGRDFKAEHAGAGDKEYGKTKWSQSLAISPDQIAEHRQLFPDVRVREDGCIGFDSYRQHDRYLEKTGFVKQTQKCRRRATKV